MKQIFLMKIKNKKCGKKVQNKEEKIHDSGAISQTIIDLKIEIKFVDVGLA